MTFKHLSVLCLLPVCLGVYAQQLSSVSAHAIEMADARSPRSGIPWRTPAVAGRPADAGARPRAHAELGSSVIGDIQTVVGTGTAGYTGTAVQQPPQRSTVLRV